MQAQTWITQVSLLVPRVLRFSETPTKSSVLPRQLTGTLILQHRPKSPFRIRFSTFRTRGLLACACRTNHMCGTSSTPILPTRSSCPRRLYAVSALTPSLPTRLWAVATTASSHTTTFVSLPAARPRRCFPLVRRLLKSRTTTPSTTSSGSTPKRATSASPSRPTASSCGGIRESWKIPWTRF